MAEDRICSISDCGKPVLARGWCQGHYVRWKTHGDPMVGGVSIRGYGVALQWLQEHAAHSGNECLTWPFSTNELGYAQFNSGSRIEKAHRRMCAIAHGEPPFAGAVACHSCGNGHSACVHPGHLYWGTRKQNTKDMIEHGRSNRGKLSPLTEADVLEICAALDAKESHASIATRYPVSAGTISSIARGANWGWLTGRG
jgi:hypothetical protein